MKNAGLPSRLSSLQPSSSIPVGEKKPDATTNASPKSHPESQTELSNKRKDPSPVHNAKRPRWADKSPERRSLRQSFLDKLKDETNVSPALRAAFEMQAARELQEAAMANPELRQSLLDQLKEGMNVPPALREAFEMQAARELQEEAMANPKLRQSLLNHLKEGMKVPPALREAFEMQAARELQEEAAKQLKGSN